VAERRSTQAAELLEFRLLQEQGAPLEFRLQAAGRLRARSKPRDVRRLKPELQRLDREWFS